MLRAGRPPSTMRPRYRLCFGLSEIASGAKRTSRRPDTFINKNSVYRLQSHITNKRPPSRTLLLTKQFDYAINDPSVSKRNARKVLISRDDNERAHLNTNTAVNAGGGVPQA